MYREIRSAEDLHGAEFDWLACDADGHVALFSSATPETHVPAAELPAPAIDVLKHLHYRHLHFAVATDISTDALQRQ